MGSSSQANIQNQVAPEFGNDELVTETEEERNGPGTQKQTESIVDPKELQEAEH